MLPTSALAAIRVLLDLRRRQAIHPSSPSDTFACLDFAQGRAGVSMGFKFQGFDFLHLDSSFSEDELLVRKTAREFVEDNLIPIIDECFRSERFPRELVPMMGERGFFGANGITEDYPIMLPMMNLESVITYEGT
jgi:hypothetical protein